VEWWNEVNLSAIPDETLMPWIQEMTAYLRARDPNGHLTTNSYAIRYLSPIWEMPEIDIIQRHEYSDQVNSPDRDIAARAASDLQALRDSAPTKPVLLGEFGYSAANDVDVGERSGIHLHNGIWTTTFAGYAGSGMYWWWDVHIEANHLWNHFRNLEEFIAGEDLAAFERSRLWRLPRREAGRRRWQGWAWWRQDLVWLRSDGYTVAAEEAPGSRPRLRLLATRCEGPALTLKNMNEGDYTVQWYDPDRTMDGAGFPGSAGGHCRPRAGPAATWRRRSSLAHDGRGTTV
jgi:hypothetical protein